MSTPIERHGGRWSSSVCLSVCVCVLHLRSGRYCMTDKWLLVSHSFPLINRDIEVAFSHCDQLYSTILYSTSTCSTVLLKLVYRDGSRGMMHHGWGLAKRSVAEILNSCNVIQNIYCTGIWTCRWRYWAKWGDAALNFIFHVYIYVNAILQRRVLWCVKWFLTWKQLWIYLSDPCSPSSILPIIDIQ